MTIIVTMLIATFGVLSLLHVHWACGGRAPSGAVVPEVDGRPVFRPGTTVTLAVAAALAACAVLVAAGAGWVALPVPFWTVRVALYALALVFLLRAVGDFRLVGFAKRVRDTRFARLDTLVYSPLCLAIAGGVLAVARAAAP